MNKQCKACGANVPSEAKFCQGCGCSEFYYNNAQPTTANQVNTQSAYTQPQQPTQPAYNQAAYTQPGYTQTDYNQPQPTQQPAANQTWQQPAPVPQPQPKKKKTGLIIGIVAASLVVLAIIGAVAQKAFQNMGYGNDYDTGLNESYDYDNEYDYTDENSSYTEPVNISYTKGTFNGSVYKNEWADIQLVLPIGYSNADNSTYSSAENSSTDCGAYFVADDTMGAIFICYEKLPTFPAYDEEKYLDAVMSGLKSASGVTYKTPATYSTAYIGGYAYTKAECEFNNGNGNFANTFYVRKLDNYMICISAMGVNSGANAALVGNIQKCGF